MFLYLLSININAYVYVPYHSTIHSVIIKLDNTLLIELIQYLTNAAIYMYRAHK